MSELCDPAEFRARVIAQNRDAFDLWRDTCSLIERVVTTPRNIEEPFERALDLLFIQAYKSFSSLYVLCVRGHGEDAATILRRLLEIALQVGFLAADAKQQGLRGQKYLAYYWAQVPTLLKQKLNEEHQRALENLYKRHKHLLSFDPKGRVQNWWGGTIRNLAKRLGRVDTYDQDYTFLSQMAHTTSQGLLLDIQEGEIEIRSDLMVREILVFGTRYMLAVALEWNKGFQLMNETDREALATRSLNFDFSGA